MCTRAGPQYYWIGEVAQAERHRARTNLTTALAELESDFDIEVTRAFAAFDLPAQSGLNYSDPEGSIESIRSCSSIVGGLRLTREKVASSITCSAFTYVTT